MDDIYTGVRTFVLTWSFLLFLVMVYWGLQDVILSRRCGHIQMTREHYLWACAALGGTVMIFLSLGEVFILHIPGGIRVFFPLMFLIPASMAWHRGMRRIKEHRRHVQRGDCSEYAI